MRQLIRHLWRNNRDQILRSSFMNCHVRGLHSVMLLDEPGKRIRLFVTARDHELHTNALAGGDAQSLGFHNHHCDLVLQTVRGQFTNLLLDPVGAQDADLFFDKYRYQSQLLGGTPGFTLEERRQGFQGWPDVIGQGEATQMLAADIHSVWVKPGESVAWLVYEGKEDPNYVGFTWATRDLSSFSFEGLYRPMTEHEAAGCLRLAGAL